MTQKEIFERLYNIILIRGIERTKQSLNLMYNHFINNGICSDEELENIHYIKNELDLLFDETQLYKEMLPFRGTNSIYRAFFEKQKISKDLLVQDLDSVENKNTIFYNKRVVLTGVFTRFPARNDLAEKLKKLGADNNASISKKTDIVCLGWSGVGPSKLAKIEELKNAGVNIEILSEQELYKILDSIN